jgi:hypothetical protein
LQNSKILAYFTQKWNDIFLERSENRDTAYFWLNNDLSPKVLILFLHLISNIVALDDTGRVSAVLPTILNENLVQFLIPAPLLLDRILENDDKVHLIFHACRLWTNVLCTQEGRYSCIYGSRSVKEKALPNLSIFAHLASCLNYAVDIIQSIDQGSPADISKCEIALVKLYEQILSCSRNCLYTICMDEHQASFEYYTLPVDLHKLFIRVSIIPLVSASVLPIEFKPTDDMSVYYSPQDVPKFVLKEMWGSIRADIDTNCTFSMMESHYSIINFVLETLDAIRTTKVGKSLLQSWAIYPILRAFHLDVGNEIENWDEIICDLVQCIFEDDHASKKISL